MINKTLLKNLSEEHSKFAAKFLEDIFVHKKFNLSNFNNEELNIIYIILKSVSSNEMKSVITCFISKETLLKLLSLFDNLELILFFSYYPELPLLKNLFKKVTPPIQTLILKELHESNLIKYSELSTITSGTINRMGNVMIQKQTNSKAQIQNETESVLDMIQNPKLSFEDTAIAAKRIEHQYEINGMEKLSTTIISSFLSLNISVSNQAMFHSHLKFLYFISPFTKRFPFHTQLLDPLLPKYIQSLTALPNGEWIAKVLNQIPIFMIQMILRELLSIKTITDFDKRKIYSKLLSEIKNHMSQEKTGNTFFAYQQILRGQQNE
jgi:hypothetical protein